MKDVRNESVMLKKWIKEAKFILRRSYPNASDEKIAAYIDKMIVDCYVNEDVKVHNNYENTTKHSTQADIENFYYSPIKPIVTESGTMFRRSPDNPAVLMLTQQKAERKIYKKNRDKEDKESDEYAHYELYQSLKKISMNSYYGASGAPACIFYNLNCAMSITKKGQSIISTANQTFESFLTNSSYFLNDNDCVVFIKNCIKEAAHINVLNYIDHYAPTTEQVMKKLKDTYEYKRFKNEDTIYRLIKGCSDRELAMLYYKNNLYKFIKHSPMCQNIIASIITDDTEFVDSNRVPKNLQDALDDLWYILERCVFYGYMTMDRVHRLKTKKRKSVMIIDTDSNMINMKPWTVFTIDKILNKDLNGRKYNDVRYSTLSTISYILGRVIKAQFNTFMKYSNVPKEKRPLLAMKNEYLYKRMLISSGKKNYVGTVEYKEGKFMDFDLDVKGLPIDKISSNAEASKFFKDLVKYDILGGEEIDIPNILRKLQKYQDDMVESLRRGDKNFLKPSRVKEAKYYDNPLGQQSVRASIHWNLLHPEFEIEAPDNVSVIKLKCTKVEDLDKIKFSHPDMYEKVKEEIFEADIEEFKKKGLYVIAIPRNMEEVPDWIKPFIDVDTIVHDNMKNIVTILKSLGLSPIASNASHGHFGNIVKL